MARRRAEGNRNCAAPQSGEAVARTLPLIERPAQPAGAALVLGSKRARMPDRHAAKVRPVRVGIADARHDGELPASNSLPQRHAGMKSHRHSA